MKIYTFAGKDYNSLWQIRNEHKNLVFCDDTPEGLLAQIGITAREEPDPEPPAPDPVQAAKYERDRAVDSLQVEVDSMSFDANETAQRRMTNAIVGWPDNQETMPWVLADNTVAQVSHAQLKKALELAVAKMGELWIEPYEQDEAANGAD